MPSGNFNLKGGPGRKKGGHNRVWDLRATLEALGHDPAASLVKIANDAKVNIKIRVMAESTLMKYAYPTFRSVELTGEDGGPLNTKIQVVFDRAKADESTDE